jgi:hypothetical protein
MKGDSGNKNNAELQEIYGEQDLVVFINSLKLSGNYMYHQLLQSVTLHFVYMP